MGFTEGLMLRTPSNGGTYVRRLTTVGPCRKRRLARQGVSRVPARALLDLVRELSPDRLLRLLRELADESRRARDEHEAAHASRRDADVGERGPAGPGPVDRQMLASRFFVHRGDEREQPEMGPERALLRRERVAARHAWILGAVDGMAEPRHQRTDLPPRLHRDLGDAPK